MFRIIGCKNHIAKFFFYPACSIKKHAKVYLPRLRDRILTIETRGGEIVLRPAVVFEVESYTDGEVSDYLNKDLFNPGERERLTKKLGKRT